MTFNRAPGEAVYHRFSSLAWRDEEGCANAAPSAVMQNSVLSTRCRNYLTIMRKFAYSFAAKRLTALIMCPALMITDMAAAVAMEHPGHESSGGTVAWGPSDPD